MSPTNTSKRPPSGAPSAKLLLTVVSVAATLGGWVAFSLPAPTTQDSTPQSLAASLDLRPIPTILPPPYGQQSMATAGNYPSNLQTNLSTLRSINVQPQAPAPVTITRSSH